MRWYADNSELNGLRGAPESDILLFGGIAVPEASIDPLRTAVESVKARYGDPRAPIKWNIKGLKKDYERLDFVKHYETLLEVSKEIRTGIFEAAAPIDFSIIVSCIESYQTSREGIRTVRPNLAQYVFTNGLMRFALCAKAAGAPSPMVILDWPDGGDPHPFVREYASAFCNGTTADKSNPYHSGPLRKMPFSDSVMFTTMLNSTLLQFADLVLGATRELIECGIGKKKTGLGVDLAKVVRHRFYGAPKRIFGRGVNVSSGNAQLKEAISEIVQRELTH